MSEHHMSGTGATPEQELSGMRPPHGVSRLTHESAHALPRAAYVPPSFRRIEVVRTANNPGEAGDLVAGS